jgi:hypothetical protein
MVEFEPFALACLLLLGMAFLSCLVGSLELPRVHGLGLVNVDVSQSLLGDLANALFMPGERFQPFLIVLGPFLGPKWFWRVLPASFLTQEPGIGLVDLEEALIGLVTDLWSNHDVGRLERYR